MHQTLSTLTAAKVWPASMKLSFDYFHMQPRDFPRPDGLVERQVCGDTRMRPGAPLCWNDIFFAENAPKGTVQAGPRPPAPTAEPSPTASAEGDQQAPVAPAATQSPVQQQAAPTAAPQPQSVPQPKPTAAPAPPKPQPTPAPPKPTPRRG
jgi:hypothetical protein